MILDLHKRAELINMLILIKEIYPEDAEYYDKICNAVRDGDHLYYEWLLHNFKLIYIKYSVNYI